MTDETTRARPVVRRRSRGRGKTVAGAATVAVAAGAAVAATIGFGGSGEGTHAAAGLPPATAPVTRQTLEDTEKVNGSLDYGTKTALGARLSGTITSLPYAGSTFNRGNTIYSVDNAPVVLMNGSLPAYRALSPGDEGADVKQLEQNLKTLGYTGFTVDYEYTTATADAVMEWQEDLGLTETGRVELGRVVFAPGAIRVNSVKAGLGAQAGPGQEVLDYTGTTPVVTVRLDVGNARLAKTGAKVQVTLPDGKQVGGTVQRVYTVVEEANEPNGGDQTMIEAIVSLSDAKPAAGLDVAAVSVLFTAAEHKDVLTVPVAALLALAEGGYGVEVVDGSGSHYVRVETGLFANGRVEISGDGVAEGTTVGMPK
jgi:peptidoglycan hydrolase-like protein with peptidoglycan-binding domain